MDLYIVRHAVAFDRDAERWPDDRERPLTPRGIKAIPSNGPRSREDRPGARCGPVESLSPRPPDRRHPGRRRGMARGRSPPGVGAGADAGRGRSRTEIDHGIDALALVGHEPGCAIYWAFYSSDPVRSGTAR